MAFTFENLDADTRRAMEQELDRDIAAGKLYISPRLNARGQAQWAGLLREAARNQNEVWLAAQLRGGDLLNTHEERKKPKGGTTVAQVPVTAADTLAEGEFNRFYARGLCARSIAAGTMHVEVYRGKPVAVPRPESEAMLGSRISAETLLTDLRASQGVEPALGLPPGPNSGLTVRLPR